LEDKEELSASAFLFEMLRSYKDPRIGGEIIMSRKGSSKASYCL
jgi:hypothetical protein